LTPAQIPDLRCHRPFGANFFDFIFHSLFGKNQIEAVSCLVFQESYENISPPMRRFAAGALWFAM